MRYLIFALCLYCAPVHAEEEPFAVDKPLASPRGTFTISQHRNENWSTTIHFARGTQPDLRLPEEYPWPALFYISPDDTWILQIQKSGSGDNISFLYHLDAEGRLWRMEQRLGELGFAFLKRSGLADFNDLYHTGIQFQTWDLKSRKLLFSIHGSSLRQTGAGVHFDLAYDLRAHIFERR